MPIPGIYSVFNAATVKQTRAGKSVTRARVQFIFSQTPIEYVLFPFGTSFLISASNFKAVGPNTICPTLNIRPSQYHFSDPAA